MAGDVHYFGIRHHGPGSARRLLQALQALQPAAVLIEGPSDAGELLPLLADARMRPPIALLAYVTDAPDRADFYPFAEFSPEYQAIVWAVRTGVPVEFIDLPSAVRRAVTEGADDEVPSTAIRPDEGDSEPAPAPLDEADAQRVRDESFSRDPIGAIARVAGYDDGESWWNDWIEQHDADAGATHSDRSQHVFEAVADAMAALREGQSHIEPNEQRREAHMRLAIAAAARRVDGPVAVVCGAWHVPALRARHKAGDDRALLAGLPKTKVRHTWVPWTSPRLAFDSGYGAGVAAPRWYAHLWRYGAGEAGLARWMVRVARTLRDAGHPASTASVIETVRLAATLARVRERPAPGFEEMRDAVIACLCGGEALVWNQHERALLLGNEVGQIPPDTPLMPLLEDLQRQQKATRLKPEALPRELALDLRSDSGLARSVLLHRLALLDVPWGRLEDAGRSRGTFRERWTIEWQPEYAVRLVENLVHGTTIEQAAAQRSVARLQAASGLPQLVQGVHACLEAQLPRAVEAGLALLATRAGHAQECVELLESLPGLISLHRYGSARELALEQLGGLVERLAAQAALALPHAARNLDAEQGAALGDALLQAHQVLDLAGLDEDAHALWWSAMQQVLDHAHSSRRVCGLVCRLMYESQRLDDDALVALMQRMLSPGVPTPEAAQFFEGFFAQSAQRLLHDDLLLRVVDGWLLALDGEVFQEQLPLLRRVLGGLDVLERRRLLDRVIRPREQAGSADVLDADLLDSWHAHEQRLLALMTGAPVTWPT